MAALLPSRSWSCRFWSSLPQEKREDADFGRPVFPIAALFVAAEKHKQLVKLPDKYRSRGGGRGMTGGRRKELLRAGGGVSVSAYV
eukprot:748080-Hanusia_phi.AAC.3